MSQLVVNWESFEIKSESSRIASSDAEFEQATPKRARAILRFNEGTQTPDEITLRGRDQVGPNVSDVILGGPNEKMTNLDTSQETLAGTRWSLPHVPEHETRYKWLQGMKNVKIENIHDWSTSRDYLRIPYYIFEGSGLNKTGVEGRDLILFNRDACKEQIEFIMETVIKNGRNGFIRGQPGTGKSTVTYFTCCCLRSDFDIVWVSMAAGGYVHVVTMQDQFMRRVMLKLKDFSICWSSDILEDPNCRTRKIFLVLDGFNIANESHKALVFDGANWRAQDSVNRRLITVSSIAKCSETTSMIPEGFVFHGVGSWTLQDFVTAVGNNEMWESVEEHFMDPRLAASVESNIVMTPVDLVKAKFYYAGESARFMFGTSVSMLIINLSELVLTLSFGRKATSVIGAYFSSDFKHTCMSFTCKSPTEFTLTGFVSQFVARSFGVLCKSRDIKALAKECHLGPQARGWMFEAFFLACVAESDKIVVRELVKETANVEITWFCPHGPHDRVRAFDPRNLEAMIPLNTWLNPISSTNPGYDAVMLLDNGKIRFIQATIAEKHDLKMWALADLVKRLRQRGHIVTDAEIFFVIPDEVRARSFTITKVRNWQRFGNLFNIKNITAVKQFIKTVVINY